MVNAKPHRNKSGVVWRVQHRIDGRVVTDTFDTEKAASEFARLVDRVGGEAARRTLQRRRDPDAGLSPTLREWTEKYLDPTTGILGGIEPGTRDGYRTMAERTFLVRLGDERIDSITPDDVGAWIAWQEKQPRTRTYKGVTKVYEGTTIAAKTMHNYHALLSNILKAAKKRRLIEENPAEGARMSQGEARESVFLSRAQFAALLSEIPDYHKPFVMWLVATQVRWSEATALQWRHVNMDTSPPTLRVHQAWKKPGQGQPARIGVTKTKSGRRTISLWPELVAILGEPGDPNDFIFQGRRRTGRLWYGPFRDRVWVPAVTRAGLDPAPTPHDLRHTGASWLIADGKPLPYIRDRLGHEDIQITVNTYGHLLPDAHTEMADSLALTMSHVLPLRSELSA